MFGNDRLKRQIAFVVEIDKLKTVFRRTYLINDQSRHENDAEHSWHLAMMAMLLSEYADAPNLDVLQVIRMLLVHDIVEIDAGDTFAYDVEGHESKARREEEAANRLFGLLPPDQGEWLHRLWQEFELRQTAESKFAAAVDRLQPLLHNYYTDGAAWKEHGINSDQVLAYNRKIADCSQRLWEFVQSLLSDAVIRGFLLPGKEPLT
jgi:putative hydrolase of HD superfamily